MAYNFPTTTVAAIPAATSNYGKVYTVTDGISESDHTVGGGGYKVIIRSNGLQWNAIVVNNEVRTHVHIVDDIAGLTAFLGSTITGVGTTSTVPKWTGASVLGNSSITDDGSVVNIGNITYITQSSAVTFGVINPLTVIAECSDIPVNGFGAGIGFFASDDTGPNNEIGYINFEWSNVAHAARTSDLEFYTTLAGVNTSQATITSAGYISARAGFQINEAAPTSGYVLKSDGAKFVTGQLAFSNLSGSVAASQMPALTGDVTTSAGTVATTIAAGVVTLAKMANMATSSLIYRKTAGSGAPEVNTLATLKTDLLLTGTNSGDQTITLTGDVTGSGTGSFAATIGATKVTSAMLNSDVFSTTHSWGATQTFTAPALGAATATSLATSAASPLLLTNGKLVTIALTSQTVNPTTLTIPDFASVSDTFVFVTLAQTLSNKTFVAPVLGTPASGVATNLTGTAAGLTAGTVTTNANLTGDVTSVGNAATLANVPTGTPHAGSSLLTNIAAPSSPASGKVSTYADSTDLRFHDKNASGVIGTTVVADTGASNQFLTAISAAGAITKAQPAFSNLSGSVAAAQMPALTGDVTTSAGAVATAIGANKVTLAMMATIAQDRIIGGATGAGTATPTALSVLPTGCVPAFTGDVTNSAGALAMTIGAAKVTNAMLAGSIAATKLTGTDIATVGTITAGVWTGTTIAVANGGSGITTTNSVRAYNSANISINNATETLLTFDSERFDNNTLHSTVTNTGRLTATVAGTYVITLDITWASNTTGIRYMYIRLNGSTLIAITKLPTSGQGGLNDWMHLSTIYSMAATDYVEAVVYQNSGGALNVVTAGNYSPEFSMARISA
jgi:hypothetical protein